MRLQRRLPQLLQVATVLTLVTGLIPPMALLPQQTLMTMITIRPLRSPLPFPPMTPTVTPSQVVTVSPWRRSARSSSRRRRSIRRNSKRTTTTKCRTFGRSIGAWRKEGSRV